MKIKHLQVTNFKGLKPFYFDFHKRLNVFIGENGSGKSSVLEALVINLGNFYYKTTNFNASYSKADLALLITNQDKQVSPLGEAIISVHTETFSNEIAIRHLCSDQEKATIMCEGNTNKASVHQKYMHSITNDKISTDLFCYFPAIRLTSHDLIDKFLNVPTTTPKGISQLISKKNLLEPTTSFVFYEFFGWIRLREDIENEKIRDNIEHRDQELSAVKNAIGVFLDADDLRISRNPNRLRIKRGSDWYNVKQLSDGERGLLCLIGDIARRLAIANPPLKNPLDGNGIILIDEIELHLHPNWQRTIIPKLLKVFPNCQFFITTHSPQILSEIEDPASVWIMKQNIYPYHPEQVYGLDSNEILTEIMGAENKPTELTAALAEIDTLINAEKYDEARKKMSELAQKTHGSVPSLVGANTMLTMMGEDQVDLGEI